MCSKSSLVYNGMLKPGILKGGGDGGSGVEGDMARMEGARNSRCSSQDQLVVKPF